MGCNQSTDAGKNQVIPGGEPAQHKSQENSTHRKSAKPVSNGVDKPSKSKESNNNTDADGGKAVAFEIGFEKPMSYDSLVSKHPPQRLKKLEPLSEVPKLTKEQLEEKIRIAEDNRQQELEKKKEVGRRSQRLRAEIQRAREAERAGQQERELSQKQAAAEEARQQKAREMEERKRVREERARRAREKAKKLKQDGGEELDYEIEKDDAFNAGDDGDSWLEGDNNTSDYHTDNDRFNSGYGDRVYSGGRESPAKMTRAPGGDKPQRVFSSSTADSFDYAFQRNPKTKTQTYDRTAEEDDDFFDT